MTLTPEAVQPAPPTVAAPTRDTYPELILRIAQFARHPRLSLPGPYGSRIIFVLKVISIDLVIRFGTIWLVLAGTAILGGASYNALEDENGEDISKLALVILAAVIAPLWEEAAMRLQIHRWSEWRFWLSLSLWASFVVLSALGAGGRLWLLLILPAGLLVWRLAAGLRAAAATQWNGHPGVVLWYVTVGFGLMHVSNYEVPVSDWRLVAIVLLIVPQILGGLLMAYTRVRVGYWGSVAHHAVSNGLLVLLVLPSL